MKKIIALLAILAFISPALASAAPFIVDQGGTGTSTLTAGQLLVGNGKGPVTGTSSPTVASINTSSTTATSTFAGNAYVKGNLQVDGNFYAPVSLVSSGNATINGILTVTGVSRFADGAVGTPSVSFTSDTNTGIYSGGADILKLVTGGADRLTINASGNVGIGTTNPTSKLHINTDGVITPSKTDLFQASDASGNTLVSIGSQVNAAGGRGYINVTNPYNDGNGSGFNFTSNGTKTGLFQLDNAGNMVFRNSNSGTGTYFDFPGTSGSLYFRIGTSQPVMWANSSGNVGLGGFAANTLPALYIKGSNFNVGIGTTNPSQKLEINGGMRLNTATSKPTCDSTVRGTFWFTQSGAGVKDAVEVCAKDAADAYAWRTIY